MSGTEGLDRFTRLLSARPVPLAEAAIAVAAHLGHAPEPEADLARVADLAAGVPGADLAAVGRHLFGTLGLRGDEARYYDPANSMLPLVLERRRGIPVTLAVLAVDVARRLGIAASVVGMPGHVLVGDGDPPTAWVDAFAGGRVLDADGARARFAALHGPRAPFDPRFLAATPDPLVLARLLGNLVAIYGGTGDGRRLVLVHELRAAIPGLGGQARPELAAALGAVGRYPEAAAVWDVVAAERRGEESAAAHAAAARLRANLN